MTPHAIGFKMPPEWYPHRACWMAWPCHLQTWASIGLERARQAYAGVANAIAQYEPVMMLVNPEDQPRAAALCTKTVRFMPLPLNDSWTRDTGPTFLLNPEHRLAGVDWIHNAWGGNYADYARDNQIASAVIGAIQATHFKAPLVMEGGSFHVDGEGTVLTSRECLLNPNRNPQLSQTQIEQYLHDYLGASKTIWLNRGLIGDVTNGHVDELACFVAPGKILALITSDQKDDNYDILQENLAILKQSTDAKGRALEIVTVEQPPATYAQLRLGSDPAPHTERLTLSYINFYTANGGIVMPAFGHAQYDQAAHDVMVTLFPTRHISQINALDIFAGGGGIHCITQQEPISAQSPAL
jgi:agmatine deiminase